MGIDYGRRTVLKIGGLWAAGTLSGFPIAKVTDKEALIAMFDRAAIDLDDEKQQLTIKVNGTEVTGTENGQVIFKFSKTGYLTEIVVWNSGISEQAEAI